LACGGKVATPATRRVLITVKAYPNPSKKYVETVCSAGIDVDASQWIRLYPVPFRDLDGPKKFKKYDVIQVRCWKAPDDHRIESYKIDIDSIEYVAHLDTKRNWESRREIVLPTVSPSFCSIRADVEFGKSLGAFKPSEVEFSWKKATLENEAKREACYAQLHFFDKKKNVIEQIPFDFYYRFNCHEQPDCPGHSLPIIDWEIGQAYRNWRYRYKSQEQLLQMIRQKWLDDICSDKKDVYFFVGNMNCFRDQFMVLGVFYPKKK
jgi:hypothetical protein